MKILFLDPYSEKGAHATLNHLVVSDVGSRYRASYVMNGFGRGSNRFIVLLGCLKCFMASLVVQKGCDILVLAWPNRLIWLLNLISIIKGNALLGLLLHNNIERASRTERKYRVLFPIYVLDSGLLSAAKDWFDSPVIDLYIHPLPHNTRNNMPQKSLGVKTALAYSFGISKCEESRSIVDFLKQIGINVHHRNAEFLGVEKMPRFDSDSQYRLGLASYSFIILLPAERWRLSASGFLLDALDEGLSIFLPRDFILKLDVVQESHIHRVFIYENEADIEAVLSSLYAI